MNNIPQNKICTGCPCYNDYMDIEGWEEGKKPEKHHWCRAFSKKLNRIKEYDEYSPTLKLDECLNKKPIIIFEGGVAEVEKDVVSGDIDAIPVQQEIINKVIDNAIMNYFELCRSQLEEIISLRAKEIMDSLKEFCDRAKN